MKALTLIRRGRITPKGTHVTEPLTEARAAAAFEAARVAAVAEVFASYDIIVHAEEAAREAIDAYRAVPPVIEGDCIDPKCQLPYRHDGRHWAIIDHGTEYDWD